VVRKEKIGFKS